MTISFLQTPNVNCIASKWRLTVTLPFLCFKFWNAFLGIFVGLSFKNFEFRRSYSPLSCSSFPQRKSHWPHSPKAFPTCPPPSSLQFYSNFPAAPRNCRCRRAQAPYVWFFSHDCPFKGPGSLPKFLDLTPCCQIDSPLHHVAVRFDSRCIIQFDSPLHDAKCSSKILPPCCIMQWRDLTPHCIMQQGVRLKF